ncbi:MAG: NifU family protein [Candidatus Omnitrophota bacterium]|nr:MAG: NifU family protein [Candidatus Omnitrophota bacterium]
MEERVRTLLEQEVRPVIQRDGGDIVFMGMDGKTVQVQLQGACVGCPNSAYTLQMGVERYLKQMIPEIEGVVSV